MNILWFYLPFILDSGTVYVGMVIWGINFRRHFMETSVCRKGEPYANGTIWTVIRTQKKANRKGNNGWNRTEFHWKAEHVPDCQKSFHIQGEHLSLLWEQERYDLFFIMQGKRTKAGAGQKMVLEKRRGFLGYDGQKPPGTVIWLWPGDPKPVSFSVFAGQAVFFCVAEGKARAERPAGGI